MALKSFKPSNKERRCRIEVYNAFDQMIEERSRTWPHFNGQDGDRNLVDYINDSELRLNGNTPSREAQGKEDWQSNLFNPVTRIKMKAIIAGVALQTPAMTYTAVNKRGLFSAPRAELIKQLVRYSRSHTNTQLETFFEAWEAAGKGTVVKFDGYLKTKQKRKLISSYDTVTGKIEVKEEEVVVDDRAVDLMVPLSEFYIRDFHVYDVQEQPDVIWAQHYNKAQLEAEFGHYANFRYVQDKASVATFNSTQQTYFYDKWANRVEEKDDYEVIRYFNKQDDRYEIWCNGVPLFRGPLLWGRRKKRYPFSKTIFEPFTGYNFFYGKSFPHTIEGLQDTDNTLINTILDKMARGLTAPLLVGMENKDLLDIDDELVSQDNKIYVPNINSVKPLPFDSVNQSEIAMLQYIARQTDLASVDVSQQGAQGKGVTAREILIADQRASELKGIFFMFLADLWLQKTRLRITNVLMNYLVPKIEKIVGKDGTKVYENAVINVKDTEFSDGTVGTLGIEVVDSPEKLPTVSRVERREEAMKENGVNYKHIAVTSNYLDDWDLDVDVQPEAIANNDKIKRQAEFEAKMQGMAVFFPEYLAANKTKQFKEFVGIYGEQMDDYQQPAPPQPQAAEGGLGLPQGLDPVAGETALGLPNNQLENEPA